MTRANIYIIVYSKLNATSATKNAQKEDGGFNKNCGMCISQTQEKSKQRYSRHVT
jgi:hypothetical protein